MKYIQIGGHRNKQNKYTLVDDNDFDWLNSWKWCSNNYGYAVRKPTKGKMILMSRLILNAPKNKFVDHIDGNPLNNQRANLRLCNREGNQRNQKKYTKLTSSIYKGVCWHNQNKNWMAYITFKDKFIYLGNFENQYQAALVYDLWATDLFGEFARTNFKVVAHK